ncbi:hypothetical protein [Mesorhizobium sp.]|uniref:hypothetical protein n=1 Tax=Mesorhizobium sp. TaxID=1871066 RepID=UPI0025C7332A|nr:hypothetical protein [Mesorhizobium sp.]
MATIPLQLAQRRLDIGSVVSYPQGSPVGAAMQGFGDELTAVAERYRRQKEQQEAFDAEIVRRQFDGQIAQTENDAVQNAPADGSGLHDAMYGQVDPRTGQVIKSGLFDKLFDSTLPKIPESQRANFIRQKEVLRATGSARMAAQQQARRDEYEQVEWTKVENIYTGSIAQSDPNDTGTFEAIRQSGLDLIGKIGNPLARQAAETAWRSNTAKALVQAMIAQDPKRAVEMLGAGTVEGRTKDDTVEAVVAVVGPWASGSGVPATREALAGGLPPDERPVRRNSAQPDGKAVWAAAPWIADLSPDAVQDLGQKAQVAMTAQLIDARTNIYLAYQNAPAALMYTGNYSREIPGPEDFTAVYGAEEGSKQVQGLDRAFDAGRQAFGMVRMPNDAIEAKVAAAKPKPGSATPEQDQARFEITASAAKRVLRARASAPADFARKVDASLDAAWNEVSKPDSYDPDAWQKAIARSVAVQQQLGIKSIQPLPPSVVEDLVDTLNDENVSQRDRDATLRDLFAGTSEPGVQAAMALQLADSNQSRIALSIANNAAPVSAEERVNRNLAAFDALPMYLKPLVALNDTVRLMADGATLGYADKFAALMNSLISGSSYEEELAAERAGTQDARDRAGSAGTAAEILGAYLTGRGLGSAGITLNGRLGTAAMEGLSGVLARTGLVSVEGAAYGAVEANGRNEDIGSEAVSGALWGAGGNIFGEGLSVIYSQLARRFARRLVPAEPGASPGDADAAVSPDGSVPPVSEAVPEPFAVEGGATGRAASEISVGHDLHLYYMPEWDAAQRAAADLKVQLLTDSETVVSTSVRGSKSARKMFEEAGNEIPAGSDVDHGIDLQLGGSHTVSNLAVLDSSVNRSLGPQIWHQIKDLPLGTKINRVTIGDR